MKNIAVIDDDIYIGNMLDELLTREGYRVTRAYSGTEAVMLLKNNNPDLILLDLMLPGLSGEDVIHQIENIPVIVISAKADVHSKVNLLMNGAVDYITKPFDNDELLARISVALRKTSATACRLEYNGIVINTTTHNAYIGTSLLRLTKTEFAILKQLILNAPNVVTKSSLLDNISLDTQDCTENSLKVHISNLRHKISVYDDDLIEAVWGIGFKMKEKS